MENNPNRYNQGQQGQGRQNQDKKAQKQGQGFNRPGGSSAQGHQKQTQGHSSKSSPR